MTFRVELTSRAQRDLAAIYEYIHAGSSTHAFRWFNGLNDAILSLENHPERGKVTRENSRLRQLLYGTKPHRYRIIYLFNSATVSASARGAHPARSAAGLPRVARSLRWS